MTCLDFLQLRLLGAASVCSVCAALCETADGCGVDGRCDFALQQDSFLSSTQLGQGDSGQQSLCIGMYGVVEEDFGRSLLDQLAQVHNSDIIGEMVNDGEVVCDEHICQTTLLLNLVHQVQVLSLYGNVLS